MHDFEPYKEIIINLYITQHRTLEEVMKMVAREYNFKASERSYKRHLQKWGVWKQPNKYNNNSGDAGAAGSHHPQGGNGAVASSSTGFQHVQQAHYEIYARSESSGSGSGSEFDHLEPVGFPVGFPGGFPGGCLGSVNIGRMLTLPYQEQRYDTAGTFFGSSQHYTTNTSSAADLAAQVDLRPPLKVRRFQSWLGPGF
ncbi:hypothetical protein QQS21_006245 [Conoideocrella luteorostrata]|uniref:Clr5 domain-containing protein n=1 Tax=Conoideocrella luteorostrata TaxID=1105319 RepID=A0AAJ0FY63_9HYPO|nr:hypothetical protein QQS21_006245 [Conoideocrella luteorostrata]